MARTPIALQLYTLREEAKQDFVGTLREVAKLGYDGVEFAGYGGLPARELKAVLAELGLKAAGSHVALAMLENELEQVIAYNLEIGNRNIVCPWLPEELRTLDGYRQVAAKLTEIGRRLREHGLQLSYHNHAFELDRFDGVSGLDILYDTDPDLVQVELDVYWVRRGGEEPVDYLRKLGKRCTLVHLKDMAAGPEQRFAAVGTGVIDFQAIFEAAEGNAEWFIVEQDQTYGKPALEEVRTSLENLRAWGKA